MTSTTQPPDTENRLREAEARYQMLAATSPDILSQFTPDMVFTHISPACYTLLGFLPDELIGTQIFDLMNSIDGEMIRTAQGMLLRGELSYTLNHRIRRKDNSSHRVETRLQALHDPVTGKLTAILGVTRDAHALDLEVKTERERIAFLTDFIRAISHDFRTPLTIINSTLYFLDKVLDDNKRQERLTTISDQVKRMDHLLDEIAVCVHLNVPDWYTFAEVDLTELMMETLHELERHEKERVKVVIQPGISAIRGDIALLKFALQQVLQNAVRFTPNDQVIVSAVQHDDTVTLQIQDGGSGITNEDLPNIFRYFYRGDKSRSTRTGGSGLGLSMVKKIVDIHEGRIDVQSAVNQGTNFKITLPMWTD